MSTERFQLPRDGVDPDGLGLALLTIGHDMEGVVRAVAVTYWREDVALDRFVFSELGFIPFLVARAPEGTTHLTIETGER